MIRNIVFLFGLSVYALSSSLACQESEKMCTQIGCIPGVSIEIEDPEWKAQPELRLEIFADGRRIVVEQCAHTPRKQEESSGEGAATLAMSGGPCGYFIESAEKIQKLRIIASWSGGRVDRSFRPEYAPVYPNGRDCPGECEQAGISVRL